MDCLISEHHGAVVALTLNRTNKRNAINSDMFDALTAALEEAAADIGIRALVLTGAGGTFSAGIDLSVLSEPRGRRVRPSNAFLHALAEFPKPLIAAVDGHAIGVGFSLALLCDLVYAATTALFRAPFLPMGLVPEAGSTLVLFRLLGPQQRGGIFFFWVG